MPCRRPGDLSAVRGAVGACASAAQLRPALLLWPAICLQYVGDDDVAAKYTCTKCGADTASESGLLVRAVRSSAVVRYLCCEVRPKPVLMLLSQFMKWI